jgi:TRAP-type C4-dicarboxylate transport system permease small subunit
MRRWLDVLYKTSFCLGAGSIAMICMLVVSQVLLNLVDRLSTLLTGSAIGLTIPSYADFTGFLLAAASFLSLAYTLREGAHIRVVLLVSRLPKRMHRLVEIWCIGFGLAISIYFAWYTARLTRESYTYNDLSSGMIAVPIWIPQTAMLLGLVILAVAFLDELVAVCRGNTACYAENGEKLQMEERQAEPVTFAVDQEEGKHV